MNKLTVVAVVFACMPTVAFAQNTREENPFAGLRGEARIGYETPTISGDNEVYKIGSTASYGGEVGFDAAISSKVTVGPYANYEFSSVELCDGGDCLKSDSNFSVGARLSYALSPKAALYVKGGYASIKLEASSGGLTGSDSLGGAYGALGIEVTVAKHVYVNVEGSYADYGEFYGTGYYLQRRHVAGGIGFRF